MGFVAKMAINSKYVREVSNIRYRLNTSVTTNPKNKDKAQARGNIEMAIKSRRL